MSKKNHKKHQKHQKNQLETVNETQNKVSAELQQNEQIDATKPQEHGRSMVELLGVLSVLGVLSIGGVQGYSYAMNKYHANEVVNELNLLNAQLAIFMGSIHEDEVVMSLGEPYDTGETINAGGYAFAYGCGQDPTSTTPCDLEETGYYMTISGVPEDICKSAAQMSTHMMNLVEQRINDHTDNGGIFCQDGENTIAYLFDANQNPLFDEGEGEDGNITDPYDPNATDPYEGETTTTIEYETTSTHTWTETDTYTDTYSYTYNPNCYKQGVFCTGNNYSLTKNQASEFCENLGYRLATKDELLYGFSNYTTSWVNNNGSVEAYYKCCDINSSVSHYSWYTTTNALCIEKDAVVEKPADECQSHADCETKYSSNQYFCITQGNTVKVCKKGSCSGDYCYSSFSLFSTDAEKYCSVFGKRLATSDEWAYIPDYRGGPVWTKNNGAIESWYKCCNDFTTPTKRSYSSTTQQSALCIDPSYDAAANECETSSDCQATKGKNYMCSKFPSGKNVCERPNCSGDNQICYVWTPSMLAVNAKEACSVLGKRLITKSEYQNLNSGSYTGNYWVDNGSVEKWYKSGSSFYKQTTSETSTGYPLCVATDFSVDDYNKTITTITTYPYTGTTLSTRPVTTTTTRPATTTTTTSPETTLAYPETTTVVYPETTTYRTTTTTTRPATTTTTTTRPATTTTTTVATVDYYPETTTVVYPETTTRRATTTTTRREVYTNGY